MPVTTVCELTDILGILRAVYVTLVGVLVVHPVISSAAISVPRVGTVTAVTIL